MRDRVQKQRVVTWEKTDRLGNVTAFASIDFRTVEDPIVKVSAMEPVKTTEWQEEPCPSCGRSLMVRVGEKTAPPCDCQVHGRLEPGPARFPHCRCGADGVRSDRWDAYYCPVTGVWLEKHCQDAACSFCAERPWKMPL